MADEVSIKVTSDIDAELAQALRTLGVRLQDTTTARVNFVLGAWLRMVTAPTETGQPIRHWEHNTAVSEKPEPPWQAPTQP